MYTYGIDISTTSIGIGILDKDGNLVEYENLKFKPQLKLSLEEKANEFCDFMFHLFMKYDPEHVKVEEPMVFFGGRSTTAHTMSILQAFNAMCRYAIYTLTGITPEQVNVKSARKRMNIVQKRGMDKKLVKLKVIEAVEKRFPAFTYTLTPQGNPKPGTDDMADAIVIAAY